MYNFILAYGGLGLGNSTVFYTALPAVLSRTG